MKNLEIEINDYLRRNVVAYYHGHHKAWHTTQVGFINTLKNDKADFTNLKKDFGFTLKGAQQSLYSVLSEDLPIIADSVSNKLTVCVIPRSRRNEEYKASQLLFTSTVKEFVLDNLDLFNDGSDYIIRTRNTPTTHTTRDYNSVKVGLTLETCNISDDIRGKDILLIDDIYTKSVNINEDCIQALYDKGARSVIFYAVGNTM
ncbi:phosphoribosyltransferase [Pedobacter sp. MC2016-24]|uniref:phosphoribosyltransferase n=1 Tax=Pedobacter sp. MC2016-24 TaxID=2780090 RepID=UPI00188290D6|nr:phosphoribosyltransferase [Pedobacter sp. MC2016-24]MBE9597991.1 phosphoribosyltransferase [Pedobacter sp. MC2016-24]